MSEQNNVTEEVEVKTQTEEAVTTEEKQEKTFTQAEVDKIVKDRLKREKAKEQTAAPEKETATKVKVEDGGSEKLQQALMKAANAEVKAKMAVSGIKPEKIERAARLVDLSVVMEDGEVDDDKLTTEINALLKEFPELKVAASDDVGKGFKVGADIKNAEKQSAQTEISRIFGNSKK